VRLASILAAALLVILCNRGIAFARYQIGQRDPLVIDPQKSYIFFRAHMRADVRFIPELTDVQRADNDARRLAAFARAETRHRQEIEQWQRDVATCQAGHASENWCDAHMRRPADITLEGFAFPPPEMQYFIDVTSGREFSGTGSDITYLITVRPGVYTLYGQVSYDPVTNSTVGVCVCMGSVKFEAPAGRIVDLGTIRYPINEAIAAGRPVIAGVSGLSSHAIVPPDASSPLPDRLAGLPVIAAELHAVDKMPNYFGIAISRVAALPGILAYQRDRVIDARTGNPVDSPAGH
jgi:hypothetical protein